jgi:multiple sugar transport system substrate-binding protein
MHHKYLSAGIAVTLCSVLLSACGGGEKAATKAPENNAVDLEKLLKTPTEVVITYPNVNEDFFNQRFGNQIKKKFPNYTFTFVPTATKDFGETLSTIPTLDIIFASGTGMNTLLLPYRLENDISDLIKKYNYDLNKLVPSTIDFQRNMGNGGVYGLPWTIGTLISLYNKDIFDKFAVAYPKEGITWDELYDLTRNLTRNDGGVQYKGLTMEFGQVIGLNQTGAPFFEEKTNKAKFTDDGMKRIFENAARFWKIPGNEPLEAKYNPASGRNAFQKEQTVAMHLDTSGVAQTTAASPLTNWDLTTFPVFKDKPGVGSAVLPDYGFITSKAKQRDAAFQVLAYLASEEYQQWMASTLALVPVLKDSEQIMKTFGESIPGVKGKNTKAIIPKSFAESQKNMLYYSIGYAEVVNSLNEYLEGKDVNTALRDAAERADKQVAELTKK